MKDEERHGLVGFFAFSIFALMLGTGAVILSTTDIIAVIAFIGAALVCAFIAGVIAATLP